MNKVTENLVKEKYKYVKLFEINTKNNQLKDDEQCDIILEKLSEVEYEAKRYCIYRIKEQYHLYRTEYLKEKIFKNFIFDELEILVNENFELVGILNVEEILIKIELVQEEIKKIENADLKLTFAMLNNFRKLVKNNEIFTIFIKKRRFYNLFYNDLSNKKLDIKEIVSYSIPMLLDHRKNDGINIIKGRINYLKLKEEKLKKEIRNKYKIEWGNLNLEYERFVLFDNKGITLKVDDVIKLINKQETDEIKKIIYFKRELLERYDND